MRGSKSAITAQENDLGGVANSEKMTGQGWAGVKKASKMLGITRGEKKRRKQKTWLCLCINLQRGSGLGTICSFSMPPLSHPHSLAHIWEACKESQQRHGDSQKALVLQGSFHARREQMRWDSLAVKRDSKRETGLQICQEPAATANELHVKP